MVIDTSAIFAAIANEPDGSIYRKAIKAAPVRIMSALTLLETRIVLLSRLGPEAVTTFDELIRSAGILVEPFDGPLSNAAFDAFRKYGKGQGGSAQLNIVDCAGYALAHSRNLPLLFKGEDFLHTDITSAIPFDR
jgi:ribonuclease VapC